MYVFYIPFTTSTWLGGSYEGKTDGIAPLPYTPLPLFFTCLSGWAAPLRPGGWSPRCFASLSSLTTRHCVDVSGVLTPHRIPCCLLIISNHVPPCRQPPRALLILRKHDVLISIAMANEPMQQPGGLVAACLLCSGHAWCSTISPVED
jgi:hypothetical protein